MMHRQRQPASRQADVYPFARAPRPSRAARYLRWIRGGCALLLLLIVIATLVINRHAGPIARGQIISLLERRYDANVQLGKLSITLYPRMRATGEGLVIRRRNQQANLPPFISVRTFSADGDFKSLCAILRTFASYDWKDSRSTFRRVPKRSHRNPIVWARAKVARGP